MSKSENYFKSPNEFNPKRWLKDKESSEHIDPFSFLPFGFGARMCNFAMNIIEKFNISFVHIFVMNKVLEEGLQNKKYT